MTGIFTSLLAVNVEADDPPSDASGIGAATASSVIDSVLDGLEYPIFIVDSEGYFTHINREALDLFNQTRDALIGDCLFDYDEADNTVMENVLETGQAVKNLEDSIIVDGEEIPVSRSVMPVYGGSGDIVAALEINRDITERKELAEREALLESYQETVITELQNNLDRLSRGDLTVAPSVPEPSADFEAIRNVHREFDEMASDLRFAVENVRRVLRETRERSNRISTASDDISAATKRAQESIGEIEASEAEVSNIAEKQVQKAQRTEGNVSNLTAAIQEITASTQQIDQRSVTAVDLADSSAAEAARAAEEIDVARAAADRNREIIRSLEEKMNRINEMTEVIADIADQTSLLALNANIEAARAGKEGAGFKVVADEVKELAEESKDAVSGISETVDDLKEGVSDTSEAIEDSNEQLRTGADAVRDVADHMEEVEVAIRETSQGVDEIRSATEDQARDAEEVHAVVEELSVSSRTVHDEMEEVATGIDRQEDAVRRVTETANSVADVSDQLDEMLAAFKLRDEERATLGLDN